MVKSFIDLKFYKILRIVLNIGVWIAAGAFLISFFVLLFIPETEFNLAFEGFTLSEINTPETAFQRVTFLVSAGLMMLSGVFCIWMLRNIVNSFKFGSPFSKDNVRRIRLFGWALIVMAYLKQFACFITADRISQTLTGRGTNSLIQARFSVIPEGAVLALCVLLLAEIFRYGCLLQSEHDTTV